MAEIAVQPLVGKDYDLLIDVDNYEAHVSSVQFVPTAQTVTWQGASPSASFSDTTTATWVCQLEYAQDWTTADSLSEYLFEHEGETVTMVFKPKKGTTVGLPIFTADVFVTPGAIGGPVNQVHTASVTLGVDGKPALTRVAA